MKTNPFKLKQNGSYSYFCLPDLEVSGLIHGFCTKNSVPLPALPDDRAEFTSAFSLRDCIGMAQEHSDRIHIIQEAAPVPKAGDGLVLVQKGVAGIIRTADCVPVILYDFSSPMAAIVHAGWRGTALRISGKAVLTMVELGARPSRIQALIGPCIGPCCYEVGEDVLSRFREARFSETVITQRNGSTFLDLPKANVEDLLACGVNTIHLLDLCTRCREDLFFSARRTESGRQFSFAALAP